MQHIIGGIQQIGIRIIEYKSWKEFFKTPLSKLEIQTTHTTAFLMEPEEVVKLVPTGNFQVESYQLLDFSNYTHVSK